jgi:pilus assembly protein CpaE
MALKLWLAGDWTGAEQLRSALVAAPQVVDADAPEADVVVCVAQAGTEPGDVLAPVREHSQAPVVLLAVAPDAGLLEADAAEVLILPQPPEAVIFAAQKATAAASAPRPTRARVITVFSPKGGTGKSVVSTNLAATLAREGKRTLLVDLDLQFGDVAIMLGLEPERTLHDLLTAPGKLDAEKIAGYATRHGSGVHVLPAPLRPEDAELITDARIAELLDAARPGYDVVVVDTAPFFHGAVLATFDRTDELLLVTAPDVPSMKNVRLTLQTLELLFFPPERIRLVLNRASSRVGFRAGQVAAVLERPVDFELPEEDAVLVGVNRGVPAVLAKRQSPFAAAVAALAAGLGGRAEAAPARGHRRLSLGRRS